MSEPFLSLKGLSKTFAIEGGVIRRRLGAVRALTNVSLTMNRGETLAIVGGSGCGKSTLAKILVGLLEPDSGSAELEGVSLLTMDRRSRARRIQMIFQDPYASLNPKLSVETQLLEVTSRNRARAIELLEQVGLGAEALRHYPFQFSGGQRQRIAIARALASNPSLLIADEPLSALDVTIQAQILTLFRTLKETLSLTLMLITHDLAVASQQADRLVVLENGVLVEEGPSAQILQHPTHAYTRALLQAVPLLP